MSKGTVCFLRRHRALQFESGLQLRRFEHWYFDPEAGDYVPITRGPAEGARDSFVLSLLRDINQRSGRRYRSD